MTTRDSTIFFPSYLIFLQFVLQLLLIGINTQSINQYLAITLANEVFFSITPLKLSLVKKNSLFDFF